MLFYIFHFIKLSATILKRGLFVCLFKGTFCLPALMNYLLQFPEHECLVSEKIPEHSIQSEVLRDILLLIPKGQMTLKGIPGESEMNHIYLTFPRLHHLTLWASVLLISSHMLYCTPHCLEHWCFARSGSRREEVGKLRHARLQKQGTD